MFSRRQMVVAAIAALVGAASPALARTKRPAIAGIDTDNDGTVDLGEAKKAAEDLFDRLDKDKDGTLTFKELQGRLSRKEFAAADVDHDGTISKNEYFALVVQRFKAADTDNDGTISEAEFHTPAGRALLRLLR